MKILNKLFVLSKFSESIWTGFQFENGPSKISPNLFCHNLLNGAESIGFNFLFFRNHETFKFQLGMMFIRNVCIKALALEFMAARQPIPKILGHFQFTLEFSPVREMSEKIGLICAEVNNIIFEIKNISETLKNFNKKRGHLRSLQVK